MEIKKMLEHCVMKACPALSQMFTMYCFVFTWQHLFCSRRHHWIQSDLHSHQWAARELCGGVCEGRTELVHIREPESRSGVQCQRVYC